MYPSEFIFLGICLVLVIGIVVFCCIFINRDDDLDDEDFYDPY